mmetsp:Transcript_18081/g.29372  ORF Transcript_18081/g.29372 Transcript_18081/m.29372 type:complete len:107 (+) Transcript_18081:96-416(+)
MLHVRKRTDQSTRRHAGNVPRSYTMKLCSNNLHRMKIVRSASYHYQYFYPQENIKHVAAKFFVWDALLRCSQQGVAGTKGALAPFVGSKPLIQTKRSSKSYVGVWR